ncbi:MAG: ABC transporter substrate-binding protein [Thermomicrobiales bacterium]
MSSSSSAHPPLTSRPRTRRSLFSAGLALAAAPAILPGVAAAASGTPVPAPVKVTVALDWYPNANHAGFFLAKERGWYAEEGLDVDLYTPADPTIVLQTVGAGKDTFGIS